MRTYKNFIIEISILKISDRSKVVDLCLVNKYGCHDLWHNSLIGIIMLDLFSIWIRDVKQSLFNNELKY